MASLSVSSKEPPRLEAQSHLSDKSVVISEAATLYLWDAEVEKFQLQGEVEARLIDNGGRNCEHVLRFLLPVAFL